MRFGLRRRRSQQIRPASVQGPPRPSPPRMRRLTTITRRRLDLAPLCRAVSDPKHGAVASFTGAVRSVHAGRRVKAVSYDCFVPLAEKTLSAIAKAAEKRWPARVAVAHRVGTLKVGEVSVAIAAGSKIGRA